MANNRARGNAQESSSPKQNKAKADTKSGSGKDQTNMQAGSGGRGGHRRRKGGSPQG